ncbi:hypothetical protein BGZ46_004757, partial [Entomortierella lignicola]
MNLSILLSIAALFVVVAASPAPADGHGEVAPLIFEEIQPFYSHNEKRQVSRTNELIEAAGLIFNAIAPLSDEGSGSPSLEKRQVSAVPWAVTAARQVAVALAPGATRMAAAEMTSSVVRTILAVPRARIAVRVVDAAPRATTAGSLTMDRKVAALSARYVARPAVTPLVTRDVEKALVRPMIISMRLQTNSYPDADKRIWTGEEDFSLTRVHLAEMKTFLCIMEYRSEYCKNEIYNDNFGLIDRKCKAIHAIIISKGSTTSGWRSQWFIKTPIEKITKGYQKYTINLMNGTKSGQMDL